MGGGDKCLLPLAGRPLIDHCIERLGPQVDRLIISANGDPARFAAWDLPVIADQGSDLGPLGGIAAALDWAAAQTPAWPLIATVPTDAPFLPTDLIARLGTAKSAIGADLACAVRTKNGSERTQPVIGLWPTSLRHDLRDALDEGLRKVDKWTARYSLAQAPFSADNFDPFFNINRREDLAEADRNFRLR